MNIFGKTCGVRLATFVLAWAVLGCKETTATYAASTNGPAMQSNGAGSGGSASANRVAYITDPSLGNMNAAAVRIPARWRFQGTLFQGDSCQTVPLAVYKATSPDGLTTAEQEPGLAWKWGTGPAFEKMAKADCLPLHGPMQAQDFLKYFADTMNLKYAGPDQVPAALQAKLQKKLDEDAAEMAPRWASIHATPPKSTFELARALVTSQKGKVDMRGRLDVRLDCLENNIAGMPELVGRPARMTTGASSTVNTCWATVTYLNAPVGTFAEVARTFDAAQLGNSQTETSWKQAWMKRLADRTQNVMNTISEISKRDSALHQQEFEHDQRVRQDMHNQFMDSFQRNFDSHQAQVTANMNARMTSASDWVDYAGDRQTVRDTTTGVTYKESNQLPVGGNEVQVHGNGSPW